MICAGPLWYESPAHSTTRYSARRQFIRRMLPFSGCAQVVIVLQTKICDLLQVVGANSVELVGPIKQLLVHDETVASHVAAEVAEVCHGSYPRLCPGVSFVRCAAD